MTIEEAQQLVGKRKLKATEKKMVELFGTNDKYTFSLCQRGHLSVHLKEEYR